jgi:phospholipid/cholesterol/gamma-HCH transport system substrate-binding protein
MPDLKKTVHNIEKITYNLKNSKGSLGKIINHPEMYNELLDAVKNMKGSFNEIQSLVVRNDDNIDSIIFGIKNSIEPAKKSFENIADITQKIKKGEGTIGKLVSDTELYETAKNTIDKVSENLEDQREQSIMSSFTNSILGIFKF